MDRHVGTSRLGDWILSLQGIWLSPGSSEQCGLRTAKFVAWVRRRLNDRKKTPAAQPASIDETDPGVVAHSGGDADPDNEAVSVRWTRKRASTSRAHLSPLAGLHPLICDLEIALRKLAERHDLLVNLGLNSEST